jgi:hypothetical protein
MNATSQRDFEASLEVLPAAIFHQRQRVRSQPDFEYYA